MKTIDRITLKGLTFLSNWMYRKFGIDNYTIGMLFVGLAMIATTFIAVMTFRLAETETIEKVVKMRQGGAVMGGSYLWSHRYLHGSIRETNHSLA